MNPYQKILLKKIKNELPSFRQDRYRFYEDHNDFVKVIEIQFLNLPENKKSFTIHFGIYVPILYQILWQQTKPRSIEASICTFFCNIDSILTNFNGRPKVKYWDIENLEELFIEIIDIVKTNLYPFSQKINSLEDLNSLINVTKFPAKYVASYPLLNATLKIILGKGEELRNLIEELENRNSKYYTPKIEEMKSNATKNGYMIPFS